MTRKWFAFFFLVLALICFGFDLYHFSHHLSHDPTLLNLEGVRLKWIGKTAWVGAVLILLGWQWIRPLAVILLIGSLAPHAFAAVTREDCERAREMMKESGMARDAKEDFFGRLKITPPRSSFPPEMDKVTWWGTFKPFEFWESPRFEAVWVNPQGEAVNRSSFRGGKCQLAKTTLPVSELPRGKLEPGMWRVVVSCEDVVIDNHPFAVIGSSSSSPDQAGADPGMMIWADGVRDD